MDAAPLPTPPGAIPSQSTQSSAAVQQVRGASLLLTGRILALGLEFVSHILIIRYLSKADYGALSYGLSFVAFFQGLAMFEMWNTLTRFLPLYRERKQYDNMFGAILLGFATVAGLGALLAAAITVGITIFQMKPTDDPLSLRLLLILVVLIPVQALNGLFATLFAAFGRTRTIFLRQYVLAPGLNSMLVLLLTTLKADVIFLAFGHLAVNLVTVVVSAWMFWQTLRTEELSTECNPRQWRYPIRELFGFAIPLLASTLVWLLMESSDALLLGHFIGTEAVASFRAVLPTARLNQLVILSFGTLFTPLATRLYTRNDLHQLSDLYRQTALWMTMLTLPLFILTFPFARATTVSIYGAQYEDSAVVMMLLSLGYFFNTCLGFNGLTVKIFKRLRYAVSIDVAAAALNVAINLLLIPRWGVMGAAIGTCGTMILHNILKQFGLRKYTGIKLFDRDYFLIYGAVFGGAVALAMVQALLPATLWIALPVSAATSLLVLWQSRGALQIDAAFPELRRWPVVRAILRPLMSRS